MKCTLFNNFILSICLGKTILKSYLSNIFFLFQFHCQKLESWSHISIQFGFVLLTFIPVSFLNQLKYIQSERLFINVNNICANLYSYLLYFLTVLKHAMCCLVIYNIDTFIMWTVSDIYFFFLHSFDSVTPGKNMKLFNVCA